MRLPLELNPHDLYKSVSRDKDGKVARVDWHNAKDRNDAPVTMFIQSAPEEGPLAGRFFGMLHVYKVRRPKPHKDLGMVELCVPAENRKHARRMLLRCAVAAGLLRIVH